MSIPTSKDWLAATSLTMKPRSTQLKAVDAAIAEYEKTKNEKVLFKIKNALDDWKRSKGPGPEWETSARNARPKRPISALNEELKKCADGRMYQITHMSLQELIALSVVAKERKKVLENIFKDKKVTYKGANLIEQFKASSEKVNRSSQQASGQVAAQKQPETKTGSLAWKVELENKMKAMAAKFFGVDGLEAVGVVGDLVLKILAECSVSVAPVIGHVKDGVSLVTGWAKAGEALYTQCSVADRRHAIDAGAPSAAFAAVRECLEDETKNLTLDASRATAAFALKTGLAFVDGGAISGPVVGAANALAEFSHKLYLLGTEWRSTKAINKSLEAGQLDIRLFQTYPLMGCYLMVSGTLSDLIPIESFGTPGWMDYIENMKKNDFDKIYSAATDLIDKSPWEIQGLPKRPKAKASAKGVFGEVKRVFDTVSPLKDLAELRDLKS